MKMCIEGLIVPRTLEGKKFPWNVEVPQENASSWAASVNSLQGLQEENILKAWEVMAKCLRHVTDSSKS